MFAGFQPHGILSKAPSFRVLKLGEVHTRCRWVAPYSRLMPHLKGRGRSLYLTLHPLPGGGESSRLTAAGAGDGVYQAFPFSDTGGCYWREQRCRLRRISQAFVAPCEKAVGWGAVQALPARAPSPAAADVRIRHGSQEAHWFAPALRDNPIPAGSVLGQTTYTGRFLTCVTPSAN